MKPRKPLKRGAPPAAKCVCGHSKSKHDWACNSWPQRDRGGLPCECKAYRPKPLARSTKPIKARKADPAKRRFAKHRNKPFTDWVAAKICLLADWGNPNDCSGPLMFRTPSDPAHIGKTRAQGTGDAGEVVNLCRRHHTMQEGKTAAFEKKYGVDLKAVALALWVAFEKETGVPKL